MKSYDEYKEINLPWLKEIPKHWGCERGKNLFHKEERPVSESDDTITCFRDGIVTLRKNRRTSGFTESLKEIGYQGIRKGDLVIHGMDAFAGAIGVSDSDGKGSPVYSVCTSKLNSNPYYYAYILREMSKKDYLQSLSRGIRERSSDFRFNIFAVQYLPVPTIDEQKQIVRYLDSKTAKINKLVQLKKKEIELLKEYRQAVITKAVTKGIHEGVKMKDSGVEWIGEIPEEWDICRLRYIGKVQNGISKSAEYFGHGYPFLSYSDVYKNMSIPKILSGKIDTTDDERNYFSVIRGDIFFTRTSETIDEVGLSSVCESTIDNAVFAGFLIRVRPIIDNLLLGFSKYYFSSSHHRYFLVKEMNLVIRASLSQNLLKNMIVLIPEISTQNEIVEYLDKKCSSIDKLISEKQSVIEKLSEYKTRLISDTVTGKIDVRGINIDDVLDCELNIPTDEDIDNEIEESII